MTDIYIHFICAHYAPAHADDIIVVVLVGVEARDLHLVRLALELERQLLPLAKPPARSVATCLRIVRNLDTMHD